MRSPRWRRSAVVHALQLGEAVALLGEDLVDARGLRRVELEVVDEALAPRLQGRRRRRRRRRRPAAGAPSLPALAPAGRQRSAALATFSTLSRLSETMRTFAVMPGTEPQVRVRRVDDDRVGDDVLHGRRGLADLLDDAVERAAGNASTLNVARWSGRTRPMSVSSIATGDLHLRQVLGDREQRRRVEARGDRLARVDLARDHDAVDRRGDRGLLEVVLREASAASRCLTVAAAFATCASAALTCASVVRTPPRRPARRTSPCRARRAR
jgi:hypothetical protein